MVGGGDVDKDTAAALALAQELPGLSAFFDHTGLDAAAGEGELAAAAAVAEGEEEEEEELEWLLNKDAFPSVETMAVEVEPAALPAPRAAVGPRTKGMRRRRRVTAPWSLTPPVLSPPVQVPAPGGGAARRRCTHCASEETPQWRLGPDGPRTLCNACGVRFKTGRLLPEYRPANSPTFSPLLHSNSHRRVLEMRRQSEDDEGSSAGRATSRARRAERAAARLATKDNGTTTENHAGGGGD